jgi:hypothetical protein
MIALADQLTGQYRDSAQLIEGMLSRMKIHALKEFGWKGFFLLDVDWTEPEADWVIQAPVATIVLGPGQFDVTVEHCRAKLKDKLWAAKQAALDMKAMQDEQGRLM